MELILIFTIIRQSLKWIVLMALVGGLGAYLLSYFWPISYRASATIYVQKTPEVSQVGEYTFDGYYAQQAAEAYADTVEGLLVSPDIIRRATELSGLEGRGRSVYYYQRKIKAEKVAPLLISLSISLEKPEEARDLVLALTQATREKIESFDEVQRLMISVDLVNAEPLIEREAPWQWFNVAVGAMLGMLWGLAVVFLQEYVSSFSLRVVKHGSKPSSAH